MRWTFNFTSMPNLSWLSVSRKSCLSLKQVPWKRSVPQRFPPTAPWMLSRLSISIARSSGCFSRKATRAREPMWTTRHVHLCVCVYFHSFFRPFISTLNICASPLLLSSTCLFRLSAAVSFVALPVALFCARTTYFALREFAMCSSAFAYSSSLRLLPFRELVMA